MKIDFDHYSKSEQWLNRAFPAALEDLQVDDFKVCANPYETMVKVTFSVSETGLGEHNFDSRVGFIAKVNSG